MGNATTKPGIKTSEFWLTLAANLLGAAVIVGLVPDAGIVFKIVALTTMVLADYGYSSSRAQVKSAS